MLSGKSLEIPLNPTLIQVFKTALMIAIAVTPIASRVDISQAVPADPAAATTPKTLKMGTQADYIPFEYREAATTTPELIGFDIDIAKYIVQKLGLTLQITEMNFNELLPALRAKKLDFVMSAITPTEERSQYLDFSQVYYESRNTIVSPKQKNYTTLQSLTGKKIGVLKGSIQEKYLREVAQPKYQLTVLPLITTVDLVAAVREGRVDAAIIENTVVEAYLETNPSLDFNTIADEKPLGVAIAFPKGSPYVTAFNQVLQEMKQNGELQRLIRQWFQAQ